MQSIERLLVIMARLRDAKNGCEWDKQQNFHSIIPYTLEETYEVIDAIERENYTDLCDELGDLLFQIVFYCQLATEQQQFTFSDVCNAISDKLERRHPHIFLTKKGKTVDWEQQKMTERVQKKQYSVLDDIPHSLPALIRADKLQRRCASVGFDWTTLQPVINKVYEEFDELLAELKHSADNQLRIEEELGDLFFSMVNLSRHLNSKAEHVLERANKKFEHRFRQIEKQVTKAGKMVNVLSEKELDDYWQQIKQQEN